jgi:hypothetical protein
MPAIKFSTSAIDLGRLSIPVCIPEVDSDGCIAKPAPAVADCMPAIGY